MHFQTTALTIRGYNEDVDVNVPLSELREIPHSYVCFIQIFDDRAFVSGALGVIDKKGMDDISKYLKEMGVHSVEWIHKGKEIVKWIR